MAISISFYNFTKRENSTTRPTGNGTTFTGYSREPMSLMNPVIGFHIGQTAPSYNYAFSADMGNRYYFVTDWTFSDNLWYATMKTDVLATYRNTIGDSTNYVLRSSHSYDGYITDTYYPMKQGHITHRREFGDSNGNRPWALSSNPISSGWYIIGVVNSDGASLGGISYYALNNTNFRTLMMALLSNTNWTNMDFTTGEISEELYKSLFNPMQYLVSCIWTPLDPPTDLVMQSLTFGWWTVPNVTAYRLSATSTYGEYTAPIVAHNLAASRGAYLNAAPFTRLTVVSGAFGVTPLDTSLYIDCEYVAIQAYFDFVAGKALLNVGPYSADLGLFKVDKQLNSMFAVPIQLAQITQDYVGAASGILSAGRGLVTGALGGGISGGVVGAIAGGIGGAASGIISAAESMLPQVQTSGLNGSFAQFASGIRLQIDHWNPIDEDNADRGRPLCRKVTLSNYPGYLLIADPDIATAGTAEETALIKEYMASGFFFV